MVPIQPSQLADFIRATSEQRANPSVIVLTTQSQLLYMNREAVELCAEINQARLGHVARGVLPIEAVNLCHAINEQVTSGQDAKAWEGTEVRLGKADPAPPILLRGFGIPRPADIHHA